MIALHLLRHAHAGDPERWHGDDAERPLSEKGRRQSERLGRLLAGVDEAPDLFISSPKVRARETAELVAAACQYWRRFAAIAWARHFSLQRSRSEFEAEMHRWAFEHGWDAIAA